MFLTTMTVLPLSVRRFSLNHKSIISHEEEYTVAMVVISKTLFQGFLHKKKRSLKKLFP